MSVSFFDLMKYAKTGIASPEMTGFDKLRARAAFGGYPVRTITGTPPISFKSDGKPLSAWSIAGAMQQTGTPTPDAPIQPEETGDKTANLAPAIRSANGWVIGYRKTANGAYQASNGYGEWLSPKIPLTEGETITISAPETQNPSMSVYFWNGDTYLSSENGLDYTCSTFTAPSGTTQIDFAIRAGVNNKTEANVIANGFWVMLNTGSTAQPYEPFGVKIPLTCAGQTSPIYLSEPLRKIGDYADTVDSSGTVTRNIKKLVLTGQENLSSTDGVIYLSTLVDDYMRANGIITCVCTHYAAQEQVVSAGRVSKGCITLGSNTAYQRLYVYDTNISTANAFKSYLAAQYAAGTPVCVWYVLATAQTETITAPTITTAKGANTLTVDTTLQPSGVSITGNIKQA